MASWKPIVGDEKDRIIKDVIYFVAQGKPISKACELAKVGRKIWYKWLKEDPSLGETMREAQENGAVIEQDMLDAIKDMVENEILANKNVKMGLEYLKARDGRFQKKEAPKATFQLDMSEVIRLVNGLPPEKAKLPDSTRVIDYDDLVSSGSIPTSVNVDDGE